MSTIEQWNARAAWCVTHAEDLERRARARVDRWRSLERAIRSGRRELLAAAHQGLTPGPAANLVAEHTDGCLVMAGAVGDGKTTGAAWRCYNGSESVLWLDAPAVGRADTKAHRETLRRIDDHGLVVLDDVGAAGSSGEYETPKVVEVLTRLAGRRLPSIITTNLDRAAFGLTYDGEEHGRLVDRLTMTPNRFVILPISEVSRRATATPPPESPPPPVARALEFLTDLARCRMTEQACIDCDVHADAVRRVASKLKVRSDDELDERVRGHDDVRRGTMNREQALAGVNDR